MVLFSVAAMAMSMSVGVAAAAPTQAQNYWVIDASCGELGDITIEVTNLGNWGAAKIQGTQLTGIPRWFTFDVSYQGTVVFSERHEKRPADVDDICAYSWTEEVPEGDPFLEAGTYLLEGKVGVKIVGR
ncbi:MAG TPA: hypothetical protein VLB67_07760 [Acidimicrobiia bacterium]|nr:hypothetical protein [Acidimicrobiia bacterium]